MTIKRKREFALVWERGTVRVAFNDRESGKQHLIVDAAQFTQKTRDELMVYGIRQIFPDSVSAVIGKDAKIAGMKKLHQEMLDGEWELGARAAKARLVMEPVFNAGRELGILFPSLADDEAARAKWAGLTEYNRLRFAAREDIVAHMAADAPEADDDIFA